MFDVAFIVKTLVGKSKWVLFLVVVLLLVDTVAGKAKWVFIIISFKNGRWVAFAFVFIHVKLINFGQHSHRDLRKVDGMVNGIEGGIWNVVKARGCVSTSICSIVGCEVFGCTSFLFKPFGSDVGLLGVISVAWNPCNFKQIVGQHPAGRQLQRPRCLGHGWGATLGH